MALRRSIALAASPSSVAGLAQRLGCIGCRRALRPPAQDAVQRAASISASLASKPARSRIPNAIFPGHQAPLSAEARRPGFVQLGLTVGGLGRAAPAASSSGASFATQAGRLQLLQTRLGVGQRRIELLALWRALRRLRGPPRAPRAVASSSARAAVRAAASYPAASAAALPNNPRAASAFIASSM